MSSIQDIERAYYTAVLGVPIDTYQTINDLRLAFFAAGPGSGGSGLTAEEVRDTIAAALVAGTNITVTVNDAGDTITIATTATVNSTDAALRDRTTHTGTQSADSITDGGTNKAYTATEKTKLAGVATGATANDTDANLKNRANHTGTEPIAALPAGDVIHQDITTGNAATQARPTARTDICVHWVGSNAANPPVNAISGDIWDYT